MHLQSYVSPFSTQAQTLSIHLGFFHLVCLIAGSVLACKVYLILFSLLCDVPLYECTHIM